MRGGTRGRAEGIQACAAGPGTTGWARRHGDCRVAFERWKWMSRRGSCRTSTNVPLFSTGDEDSTDMKMRTEVDMQKQE